MLAVRLLSLLRFAIANTNFHETRGRERRWILDLVKLHEENCKARKRSNVSSPSHSRELFRFHLELGYLRWICRNAMSLKCIGVSPLHQSMAEY